jgi:amino acid transporter
MFSLFNQLISNGDNHFLSFGLAIVIGHGFVAWNHYINKGFGDYAVAVLIVTVNYILHFSCLTELSSSSSFLGGSFGITRVTINYYVGFLVGSGGILKFIFISAYLTVSLGKCISMGSRIASSFEPLIWFVLFIIVNLIGGLNRKKYRAVFSLILIATLIIIGIYVFGSIPHLNFDRYAYDDKTDLFQKKGNIIKDLPFTVWWFCGLNALNLVSDEANQPRKKIPWAFGISMIIWIPIMTLLLFISVSLPPKFTEFTEERFLMIRGE